MGSRVVFFFCLPDPGPLGVPLDLFGIEQNKNVLYINYVSNKPPHFVGMTVF